MDNGDQNSRRLPKICQTSLIITSTSKEIPYILSEYEDSILVSICNKIRMISQSRKQKTKAAKERRKNKHSFHLEVCELVHDFSEQNLLFVAVALHIIFILLLFFMNFIHHCFICRLSNSTVSEDAGIDDFCIDSQTL
jgi:hypothetical protein